MDTRRASELPSALEKEQELVERLLQATPAVFFDYDGTLTPIVDDPAKATLSDYTRSLLRRLAERWSVVIMSGRGLDDVRALVGVDNLVYAGSHGFNIVGANESFREQPFEEVRPEIDRAEVELRERLADLTGVKVERKLYAIALHYRQASEETATQLEQRVNEIAKNYPGLWVAGGKKIFEFRPNVDWNKGKSLLYLLDKLHLDRSQTMPIYFGDDVTDEDAFKAIADSGIGILVAEEDQETAARYVLRNPDEVTVLLEELVTLAEIEPSTTPWALVYEGFDPETEQLRESLCTLGNGYFASRGAAPESSAGEVHYPGTYIAGVYNRLESEVAGRTIENESIVNVPNWLPLTFRIEDGDWFDLSSVEIHRYRQELDMGRGLLVRTVEFSDSEQRRTRLTQRRFVHMSYEHLAGLETTLLPVDWSGRVTIRTALDGTVENTLVKRYRALNNHHLEPVHAGETDDSLIWLQVETNQSQTRITEAARTTLMHDGQPVDVPRTHLVESGYIGQDMTVDVEKGKALRIEKLVSVHKSGDPAMSNGMVEALDNLRSMPGFSTLADRHSLAWRHLWQRWKISLEAGSAYVQQVLNLHIFHLLQVASPNTVDLDVGVPPRGLHGEAYRGLIMWDDLFIFPIINLRMPDITRALLMYRYRRLPRARWAAAAEGYRGAMFPWQSGSDGREQAQQLHLNPASGRWIPDNTQLERHINLAVAYNIWQFYQVTDDMEFMSFYGAQLMLEIARFWVSKVSYDDEMKRYRILRVMGPDEFHDSYPDREEAGIDDNAYTNIMVAWLLWRALEMLERLPDERRRFTMEDLALKEEEVRHWDSVSRNLYVPFHDGVISQFHGYGDLKEFDWEAYREKYGNIHRLDRILESEGDSPNRYKVSKQADVLMLFYLLSADELEQLFTRLGYEFDTESIPGTVDYYLDRTAHGSTLSRVVHAWVLARSHRELSWQLFRDALESDVEDIQGGTTHEGIHLGAMAGTVDLILRAYSGMESRDEVLWFSPCLPPRIKSLDFAIRYRGARIDVDIKTDRIRLYSRPSTQRPITIGLEGETRELAPGEVIEIAAQCSV